MRRRLCAVSAYGLSSLRKGDELHGDSPLGIWQPLPLNAVWQARRDSEHVEIYCSEFTGKMIFVRKILGHFMKILYSPYMVDNIK